MSAVFAILLVLSIVLNRKMLSMDKEALCTEVDVKVEGVKTVPRMIGGSKLLVSVSYEGELYELKGAGHTNYNEMSFAKMSGYPHSAWLYKGSLYYQPYSVKLIWDYLYYASALAAFLWLPAVFVRWDR